MKARSYTIQGAILLMLLLFISCNHNDDSVIDSGIIEVPDIKTTTIQSEKDGFTINLIDKDFALNVNIKQALINTFHEVYPKMVADFNPSSSKNINVIIDPTYDGVAYAYNGEITVSSTWITNNPQDTDLLTHELMHIVQSYSAGNSPGWLIEGIADYARDEYGTNNTAAGWFLPAYSSGQNYTDAYRVTASFLIWIESNYDGSMVNKLNENLSNGTYSLALWVQYTGFSLHDLWLFYSGNYVEGGDVDWTNSAILTVSKENGGGVNSPEGSLKVIDNDINSKFFLGDYTTDFWMQQELPQEEIVNKYTITSGNDVVDRDPKNWTLSGSNDKENWIDLDTRSDQGFASRNETIAYTFNATEPYKHYRISITENSGSADFQLSEWRLIKVE